ncbi:MAG: hypothetical protein SVX43_21080 [Cyanobacteriota bacterium]|nr:hypothetical protein [Cyanobacteriota bacterium]
MSKGSRIAIGIVALLGAVGFFLTALDPSDFPAGPPVFYGLAAVFAIVAIACFFPKSHPVSLRLIGAIIFAAYVGYIIDSFQTQDFGRAVVGFIVWGVPSGYMAISGKFPLKIAKNDE